MMQLLSKNDDSSLTSSLRRKNLKIDKFGDFSCNINYNSRIYVSRDVVPL